MAQITAGKTVRGGLNLEAFPVMGLLTTHCEDRFVTDSGAAATALATGFKTHYYGISMNASGDPFKTVLEYAEEGGKSTGLVVTSRITHATPAAFASHEKDRHEQSEIAEQLLNSGTEVLFGGGLAYFLPQSDERSKREDDENVLDELRKNIMSQWIEKHSKAWEFPQSDSVGQPVMPDLWISLHSLRDQGQAQHGQWKNLGGRDSSSGRCPYLGHRIYPFGPACRWENCDHLLLHHG